MNILKTCDSFRKAFVHLYSLFNCFNLFVIFWFLKWYFVSVNMLQATIVLLQILAKIESLIPLIVKKKFSYNLNLGVWKLIIISEKLLRPFFVILNWLNLFWFCIYSKMLLLMFFVNVHQWPSYCRSLSLSYYNVCTIHYLGNTIFMHILS